MEQPAKTFLIDGNLAQGIINYLATRPFAEVEPMINGMRKMEEVDAAAYRAFIEAARAQATETGGEDAPKPNGDGEHLDA